MTPSEIVDRLEITEVYEIDDNNHALGNLLLDAAATIRAQAEALKIATGALEAAREGLKGNSAIFVVNKALARIKEVE